MTDTYHAKLEDALEAVQHEQHREDRFLVVSTGVTFLPRKINPLAFQQVASKYKDPPIPYVFDEVKGRDLYNPQDPDYLAEKKMIEAERSLATIDAIIALGTQLSPDHPTPQDVPALDSDDWVEDLEAGGIEFDSSKRRMRYLMWVKYIACPTVQDIEKITDFVLRTSGISAEATVEAVNSFPDNPK